MKGISEIVATVLVIVLVVLIGGIVGIFVMNFTKSQTGLTQHSSENMAKCGNVILTIDDVKTDADLDPVNVTFTYSVGTEDLYNFSVYLMDIHANLNSTSSLSPNYNATNPLRVGKQVFWSISTTGWGLYGELSNVRVQGICRTDNLVAVDCNSGESCMK